MEASVERALRPLSSGSNDEDFDYMDMEWVLLMADLTA